MFLFFFLFVLGDLLARGGRVEVPVWERRMDALGYHALGYSKVNQPKLRTQNQSRILVENYIEEGFHC